MTASQKLIQAAAGVGGGEFYPYTVDYSCRFNDDDSAYLRRVFGTPTNNKKWTYSIWVKRCNLTGTQLLSTYPSSGTFSGISFNGNPFRYVDTQSSTAVVDHDTNALFRDPSAWMHLMVACDTTDGTAADRVKYYQDGVRLTLDSTGNVDPALNANTLTNSAVAHFIGAFPTLGGGSGASNFGEYYLAQVAFVDGQALTASSFGEDKNGVWVPKNLSGLTFGTNGFWLDFADSADLGNDVSGNNNDFTSSGLTSADQMIDTPTNNFATWSPLQGVTFDNYGTPTANLVTYSNGNLDSTSPSSAGDASAMLRISTMEVPYDVPIYVEVTNLSNSGVGVGGWNTYDNPGSGGGGDAWDGAIQYVQNGVVTAYSGASFSGSGTPLTATSSDIIGMVVDRTAQTIKWYKNNTLMYTASSVYLPANWFVIAGINTSAAVTNCNINFGQLGFTYTPPDSALALCTANLPEPVLGPNSAENVTDYFAPILYTGNGTAIGSGGKAVTGVGFQSDMVVIKNRDAADSWRAFDTGCAAGVSYWEPDVGSDNEASSEVFASIDADGFTLGNEAGVNTSLEDYVAYCWREHTGFFDQISFTGTASAHTESHSLDGTPDAFIVRNASSQNIVVTYSGHMNVSDPETDYLDLSSDLARTDDVGVWNDTAPTSSVITVGTSAASNGSSHAMVGLLFKNMDGMCKVGVYFGNGSTDGPFVYCGFRPAFVMFKRADSAGDWYLIDTARSPNNRVLIAHYPSLPNAEGTAVEIADILSNGFKLRNTVAAINASGGTVTFMAFAEMPFKYSNAR